MPNGIRDEPRLNKTCAFFPTLDFMKDEYDFLAAKRGRFFREGARLAAPIHLDLEVFDHLSKRALAQQVSLSSLVNALLRKQIELIEASK